MTKVITYGTYDLLHYGHIRLLERAKALGDYLIVGVTSDDYDKTRGKINNQQSLIERIAAVKATGIADEIIVEEYEGQKIDDIRRNNVDIFTVGSDWEGKFDYLNEYCKVIYLPRTEGVSSSEIRAEKRNLKIGVVGVTAFQQKIIDESAYVNGVEVVGIYADGKKGSNKLQYTETYEELLDIADAVYIASNPENHYSDTKKALLRNKHVLCESPIAFGKAEASELYQIARERGLSLMDAIKTAYSTAYERLVLLSKGGRIGQVVSVDAVCTSMKDDITTSGIDLTKKWSSMCAWGPAAVLPVLDILGNGFREIKFYTRYIDKSIALDAFTKIDFVYPNAVASVKVAKGAKSEGELVITGTKGYIYVPSPWWKTDYFEIRYENPQDNKRFFYQLDGEGIRYMILMFSKEIESKKKANYISEDISCTISDIVGRFYERSGVVEI